MIEDFKKDLQSKPTPIMVSKWITDRTPLIFDGNHIDYLFWKESLSEKIGIDGRAITIIGSACLGFSLNPGKNFKEFDDGSDIDVAIISNHYFDVSWHHLRNLGAEIYKLSPKQQSIINDHVHRLIYWGTIATDKILELLPFGSEWIYALNELSKEEKTLGREINIRIYKDFESLKAYQIMSVKKARDKIISTPEIEELS